LCFLQQQYPRFLLHPCWNSGPYGRGFAGDNGNIIYEKDNQGIGKMGRQHIIMIICYLGFAAGIFYIIFLKKSLASGKIKSKKRKINIIKGAVKALNIFADRLGCFFLRPDRKEKLNLRTRILEILEQEKNIDISPAAFLGYKILIAVLLAAAGVFIGNGLLYSMIFMALGLFSGYFIPDILIFRYSAKITLEVEKELSYMIDLLRILALSGQNIYKSFKILSRKYNGRISASLRDFTRYIDMGAGRQYAYRNLMLTSRSEQFREFVSVLHEADRNGSPIDDILSRRSKQINHDNWDNVERQAKKKGLLTLLPLTCLILPAFIMLVGGPLIYSMASGLLF
jgi:pilus assembly protein TadC